MRNVDDLYPLSPMQQVMLLHAVSSRGNDVLFNRFCYDIEGELDAAVFERAWQTLVQRHPALRTSFVWDGVKQPLNVVRAEARLPWETLDLRALDADAQQDRLALLEQQDTAAGFDLTSAPLMRATLVRLGERLHRLVWTSHHLILDRWCLATVWADVTAAYQAGGVSAGGSAPPFRRYVQWLLQQPEENARRFWQETLRGMAASTPLIARRRDRQANAGARVATMRRIPAGLLSRLRQFARANASTAGVVSQVAWALMLARLTGRSDIGFAVTVAGRPPEVADVDSIVGTFINNVPVRIDLGEAASATDCMRALQRCQQRRLAFEHVSAGSILEWSGLARSARAFDHLLVWLAPDGVVSSPGLSMRPTAGVLQTAYPLTLAFEETSDSLTVHAFRDPASETLVAESELLNGFEVALADLVSGSARDPVATLRPVASTSATSLPERPAADEAVPGGSLAGASPARCEAAVAELFRSVFKREAIGPDDDFFDLGGDSVAAARVHAGLEQAVGRAIPMIALFRAPTVRRMARMLIDEAWPEEQDVVSTITVGGDIPALFCVAAPEVNAVGYTLLARHLPAQLPIRLVQPPIDGGRTAPLQHEELPDLANRCIAALRAHAPHGPYRLLGMCSGAHLALEMARQLEQDGAQVGFLGFVDTHARGTNSRLYYLRAGRNMLRYYVRRVRDLADARPADSMEMIRAVLDRKLRAVRARFGGTSGEPEQSWLDGVEFAPPPRSPPRYAGEVTVFKLPRQPYWRRRLPDLGWGAFAEHVEVEILPDAPHWELLREPVVRDVAALIARRIA